MLIISEKLNKEMISKLAMTGLFLIVQVLGEGRVDRVVIAIDMEILRR